MNADPTQRAEELDVEFLLDQDEAAWFEMLTGIHMLLDRKRTCCAQWINHGRKCPWNHSCDQVDSTFDHPVQALDAEGNRCVLLAPYRLRPSVEVVELDRWCARHSATWEIVPVTYWGVATITVVVRHVEAPGRSWRHFLASDIARLRNELGGHT